jgi:biopolymer transport protein ExbB/TolQ
MTRQHTTLLVIEVRRFCTRMVQTFPEFRNSDVVNEEIHNVRKSALCRGALKNPRPQCVGIERVAKRGLHYSGDQLNNTERNVQAAMEARHHEHSHRSTSSLPMLRTVTSSRMLHNFLAHS